MYCDLHTHSSYSDGTLTPTRLVELAESKGMSHIALTDHNTVKGLDEFVKASEGKRVTAIPGIEFSTEYKGTELHILGLFIKPEHYGRVNELLDDYRHRKEQSNINLAESLNRAGYKIDYTALKAANPKASINRAHFAAELVRLGYGKEIKLIIDTLLSKENGLYVPPKRLDALEIIDFIKEVGGVSVLAHPFLNLSAEELKEFIMVAKLHGLNGMETVYSLYDEATEALAKSIAESYGLLHSGGSDFHGANKPDISLGIGKGNLKIPTVFAERLTECIGR